jgi:UDP-N-acetyl-D-mannosaminuronate dehydrogenase
MEAWKPSSVGIIGLWYVGLPLAVGFAQAGLTVHGVKRNADKVTDSSRSRTVSSNWVVLRAGERKGVDALRWSIGGMHA